MELPALVCRSLANKCSETGALYDSLRVSSVREGGGRGREGRRERRREGRWGGEKEGGGERERRREGERGRERGEREERERRERDRERRERG